MAFPSLIVGVDEAGRGPLAGPVVAAAVILGADAPAGLADSKVLSARRRAALEPLIKATCRWGIGVVGPDEIDRINIFAATMRAMTLAVTALLEGAEILENHPVSAHPELVEGCAQGLRPGQPLARMLRQAQHERSLDHEIGEVLIDGNKTPQDRDPDWIWPARAIVGGDASEPAISAASILAKEHRDRLMRAAAQAYPHYGWERNAGYGTREHLAALRKHGPCPLHRRSFAPVAQAALL